MKNNQQLFNNLLIRYHKYLRKRKNLILANRNQRRQLILAKHIERLYEKLMGLKLIIQKGTSVTLVASALALGVNDIQAQIFRPVRVNPFGLMKTNLLTTSPPELADLDNDGDLDLLVVSDDFTYFENTGTAALPIYGIGQRDPFSLDTGLVNHMNFIDLDNDGDLDLMAADFSGDFYYYENIGTAGALVFGLRQKNPFSLIPNEINPAISFQDLDNDGDLDLMTSPQYGDFYYYENIGTADAPTFDARIINPFGLSNRGIYIGLELADLDNDGDFDLMYGHEDRAFHYIENEGTIFTPVFGREQINPFSLTSIPRSYSNLALSDMDNDGDFDLISLAPFGDFTYFENYEIGIPEPPFDTRPFGNKTICKNEIAQLSVMGVGVISWYDAPIGGNWLAGGNTYITDPLNASTTFYAQDSTFSGASAKRTAITVNIDAINTSTSVLGATINSVKEPLALYQWLDCNNGWSPIAGETNDSYTVIANGDYAVAIAIAGCTDTSVCNSIILTDIDKQSISAAIKIYPNPAKDEIRLDLGELKNVHISILNSVGKEVYNSGRLIHNGINISLAAYSKGIYFVKIIGVDEHQIIKLIKN